VAVHRADGNRRREAFALRYLADAQARAGSAAEARVCPELSAAIFDDLGDAVQAAEVRSTA
jgi:hypothetical protein